MRLKSPTRGRTAGRVAIVGAVALSLALAGCGSDDSDSSDAAPIENASITLASTAITTTLDPHAALSSVGRTYSKQVFDQLVTFDAAGKLIPGLATEWKRVNDTTMEFTLREDVEFSTGNAFSADDIKANVDRVLNGGPTYAVIKGRLGSIKSAKVVSPTVVQVITENPDAILLNRMTLFDIVDPSTFKDAATKAAGTGPFKVTSYSPAEKIDMTRVDDAWRASKNVEKVTLQAIPNPSTLASALKTNAVDVAFGISADIARQLEGSNFSTISKPAGSSAITSLIADAEPKLADVNVRKAINLAINREEFVDAALGGYGKPNGSQLLQPGYFGYDESIEGFAYDPDEAKKLIAAAGAEGLKLPIATTALFKQQAETVAGYLNAVGFKSEVVVQELSAFIPTLLQKSKYPLLYWQTDYYDLRDISSVVRFGPTAPGQQAQIPVNEYQDLFVSQQSELDETKREASIKQMANILQDEAAVTFLAWPDNIYTTAPRIKDLPLSGDSLVRVEAVVVTE
jgi:peptide/nickel transport system substrate-binding protein